MEHDAVGCVAKLVGERAVFRVLPVEVTKSLQTAEQHRQHQNECDCTPSLQYFYSFLASENCVRAAALMREEPIDIIREVFDASGRSSVFPFYVIVVILYRRHVLNTILIILFYNTCCV